MSALELPETLQFNHLSINYCHRFVEDMQNEGVAFPEELIGAVLKRRCEYLAGRVCSQRSLLALNYPAIPQIKIGSYNQPLWPDGTVGSISHCAGHAVAVVANRSDDLVGVGMDIERFISLELAQQIGEQLMSDQELNIAMGVFDYQQSMTLSFSAKESIYKAIFSTVNCVLDFDSAVLIGVDANKCELTFEFSSELKAIFISTITVRYYFWNKETILTWCCLAEKHLRSSK